ncbi:hypothetical protein LTS18_011143, partial [Coniosporium uncinatum]
IKLAPSRWDEENLHRHPDYAPVRKASISDSPADAINKAARTASLQSNPSTGTEYEDEFGGNLFDGVDLKQNVRPDEVLLDKTSTDLSTDISDASMRPPSGPVPHQARQQVSRVQSMPAMRAPTPNSLQDGYNQIQQGRPQAQSNGPQTPNVTSNSNPRPPVPHQQQQQQQQQRSRMLPPPLDANQQSRSHAPQTNATDNVNEQLNQPAQTRPQKSTPDQPATDGQTSGPQLNQESVPSEPAVGFISGRTAEMLLKSDSEKNQVPANMPAFNPHADSPSIRRSSNVHQNKSAPISRQSLNSVASTTNGQGATSGPPIPPKPNFVNPQGDVHRRIGMPGAAQSPLSNRSSYKPPSAVGVKRDADTMNRPPLADVSNIKLDGGGGGGDVTEAKRAKLNQPPGAGLQHITPPS